MSGYKLEISKTSMEFSPGGESLATNKWSFSPESGSVLTHIPGSAQPSDLNISTTIKNYATAEPNLVQQQHDFEDYFVKISVDFPVVNQATLQLYEISGEINEETDPDGYDITDGLEVTTTLEYISMDLLLPGTYETRFAFFVYGKTTSGSLIVVDTIVYTHTIKILALDEVVATKKVDNFFILRSDSLPSAHTLDVMCSGDFEITIPSYFGISGSSIVLVSDIDGVKTYSGEGVDTITYGLTSAALTLDDGNHQALLLISSEYGSYPVLIDVILGTEPINFSVSPEQIEWNVIEGIPTNPDAIQCWGAGNNTVTVESVPPWLSYTLQYLGAIWLVELTVNTSGLIQAGIYDSEVIVKCASVYKSVHVKLNYSKKVNLNLLTNQIHFTDDYNTISTFHNSNQYDVALHLNVKTYDLNNNERTDLLPLRFGLFQNKAEYFIGQSVKKVMSKLMHPSEVGQNYLPKTPGFSMPQSGIFSHSYYKPAKVRAQITFINRNTNTPDLANTIVDNIYFVKGRKPSRWQGIWGLLHFNDAPIRVTAKSLMFFNYYSKTAVKLSIYRNNTLYTTHYHSVLPDTFLHTSIIPFYAYSPGDVIEVKAENLGTIITTDVIPSQKYIVFPEGKESYHIAWVNEHEMLETMEFTGAFTYQSETEHRVVNTYASFLEQLEKVSTSKNQKIVCNTGFILQSDSKKVQELLESKRAFLMFPEATKKNPIHLIPVSKTLKNLDSDQNLYNYEVEFQINLKNDSEIYPR